MIPKQFGKQFSIMEYEEILPTSIEGIERYLSTGIIKGISPITAKRIVKKFKEKLLDILDNNIERLLEVEGIGEKNLKLSMILI